MTKAWLSRMIYGLIQLIAFAKRLLGAKFLLHVNWRKGAGSLVVPALFL
jgi:hypothetical protein